ncbi:MULTISPECIES: PAS-domain containing protein [Roseobacteraceae]|uniref:Sensor protein DivL n=1 Tax=Pseudosulfitobacter pseudonitzschiae TaxID=1402135 RepID=A0A221K4S4_9RHOB|nr:MULTISPECIES: PAS-domain containing protein [Roseobacteraceae]ASM73989.1 sensor protein DivL [Pseudosulfitobacter pseudonitzschiae]
MPLIDIITLVLVSCFSAAAVLGLCCWFGFGRKIEGAGDASDIKVLFEGDLATHASPAALVAFNSTLDDLTWDSAQAQLRYRFQNLPPDPAVLDDGVQHMQALMPGDGAVLTVEKRRDLIEMSLSGDRNESVGYHAQLKLLQAKIDTLERSSVSAPYPMWQKNQQGHITWKNAAYDELAQSVGQGDADIALFDDVLGSAATPIHRRAAITTHPDGKTRWFDASQQDVDGVIVAHAVNIDAVIDAEVAQRNFVQTLAKTFAQLSIGLAIFDRKGQLALFNPALVDLTRLPAEFLSTQPYLLSFFDHLRENRMMPEPKNYGSWRQDIAELIKAASDGRYLEIWTLESGQTYRVSGKPHPDRAVAFLIEDISAEIALTRNFRAELEMGQSMMDALSVGLAVFTPAGVLTLCNCVYSQMWGFDPDRSFADITINDSVQVWRAKCVPTTAWDEIRDFVKSTGPRTEWQVDLETTDSVDIQCTITPLTGGATMLKFRVLGDRMPNQPDHLTIAQTG